MQRSGLTLQSRLKGDNVYILYQAQECTSATRRHGGSRRSKLFVGKAYDMLGHSNEDITRAIAKYSGWELSQEVKLCQSCVESNAKREIIP